MMKLLSLALLCLLSSTAGALQCQTCSNANCSTTTLTTCTTETMCITATAAVTLLIGTTQSTTNTVLKACAAPQLCQATGDQTYAIDESVNDTLISSRCCNTDNCNSETLPVPVKNTTENDLECHFCFRTTCDIIIKCKGPENRCFGGRVASGNTMSTVGGCVSQNVCDLAPGLWSTPIVNTIANVTAVPTCCSGKLCNNLVDSPTTAASAANATTAASGAGNANTTTSGAPGEVTIHSHFIRLSVTHVFLGLLMLI